MRCGRHSHPRMPPYLSVRDDRLAMLEILFIYQLARNPIEWMTRRFWCRSLYRATRGKRGCPESTNS